MKILNEFKEFAIKGNMIDISIGIIIGGAFNQVTNSLVNNIVMPPLGLLTGNIDFSNKSIVLRQATETAEAVTLGYGLFINVLLNFIIVSFVIFLIIRQMNKVRAELEREKEELKSNVEVTEKPDHLDILSEIRDLLKNNRI
jgi:large conductance mechanosensitive channel